MGGIQPVKWILRCGVLDILPSVLTWTSTHEASVAIFLLQRLMLSESGPRLLVQHLETLHKPPIHLLGDFLSQHISEARIHLSPDTVAGILYLYSKAIMDTTWELPNTLKDQFQQILALALKAEDTLVRAWGCFALATSAPLDAAMHERIRELALTDAVQSVRTAASFVIWQWHAPPADMAKGIRTLDEDDPYLADYVSRACQDASYLVRTFAFALAMEIAALNDNEFSRYVTQLGTQDDLAEQEEKSPLRYLFGKIVATLRRGCRDPLRFLQKAVQQFLIRLRAGQDASEAEYWTRVFPDMPLMAAKEPTDKVQLDDETVSLTFLVERGSLSHFAPVRAGS